MTRPGDVIITNQITYYGLKALANLLHLEIREERGDAHRPCLESKLVAAHNDAGPLTLGSLKEKARLVAGP